jgi:uncharacterized protein
MASPVTDLPARRSVKSQLITAITAIAVVAVSACGVSEPQSVPVTTLSSVVVPTASTPGATPQGFETMGLRILPAVADMSEEVEMCVWAAVTPEQRSRGLMRVTDLGGADGMAFIYAEDRTTSFTMRNTVIDLSIAFFDAEGTFMDSFDMTPCGGEPCPNYPTPTGFRLAVEVPAGDLERWGIGPGSAAFLRAHCDTP